MAVKNQRIPAELSRMLAQIAWFERKTVGAVLDELAGKPIRQRFDTIPKHLRDRKPSRTNEGVLSAK